MSSPLAIDGGQPVRSTPMPPWPSPGPEETAAVTAVLESGLLNYWTGQQGRLFESEFADFVGRRHGIAVANGTVALELALRTLGVGQGDDVIVPSRTFIATASAVVAVGATPVVADIDRDSSNVTADTISDVLSPRTRAVIPVHFAGWPAEMDPISELARERGIVVIEDCAQAHGARYRGRAVGALGSDAAAFSFCHDKVLPVGEGGMLLLDDEDAYAAAWGHKDHGKSLRKIEALALSSDRTSFKWLHDTFGTNWRLDEMSSALGRVGLAKLPEWHRLRTRNALRLAEALGDLAALRVPLPGEGIEHAFYRLYAYVVPEALKSGWDRDRIAAAVSAEGVQCQYGGCAEIYREEAFSAAGLGPRERLPIAAEIHETSLSFCVHPTLGTAEMDQTAEAVRKVVAEATA